jgi:hypothetical protein
MSKFSLPFGKASNKPSPRIPDVDLSALEAFASGARSIDASLAESEAPLWSGLDRNAAPKYTLSIRVNDYHLAMIRQVTAAQDTTQNRLLRRLLLPEIEALAVASARQAESAE